MIPSYKFWFCLACGTENMTSLFFEDWKNNSVDLKVKVFSCCAECDNFWLGSTAVYLKSWRGSRHFDSYPWTFDILCHPTCCIYCNKQCGTGCIFKIASKSARTTLALASHWMSSPSLLFRLPFLHAESAVSTWKGCLLQDWRVFQSCTKDIFFVRIWLK